VAAAAEHVERALDFCDRALDHLKNEESNVGEALPLIEATRTELLALQKGPESGKPDGDAVGQEPRTVRAAAR
jgi:hypothetical protein